MAEKITLDQLLDPLSSQEGVTLPSAEDLQAALSAKQNQPILAVRIISALGAWCSGILLTIFIFMMGWIDGETGAIILGSFLVVTSIGASYLGRNRPLLSPFTLVFGLVGQIFLTAGIVEPVDDLTHILLIVMGIQAVILALTQQPVQRFFSTVTLLSCGAWILFEEFDGAGVPVLSAFSLLVFAGVWLREPHFLSFQRKPGLPESVAFGFGLFGLVCYFLSVAGHEWTLNSYWWTASGGMLILGILWAGKDALRHLKISTDHRIVGAVTLLALAPLVFVPGILAGLLVMMIGFARGSLRLTGFGLVGFAFYIIAFYYNLDTTLLTKSIHLLIGSAVFLGARWLLKRWNPSTNH